VVDPALARTPPPEVHVGAPVDLARSRRRAATGRRAETSGSVDVASLVAAARLGEAEALDALVRATYTDAYTLAYRLTGNDEDAGDVVQEAFLRAHRGLARFRGDAQFTTWLYRITVNCASTTVRKRRRTRTEVLADDAPVPERRAERDPEWRATTAEDRAEVTVALAALPARLRQVIVLRDIYDLPHRAIAAELGISEAAAKVRLHRARRRLKAALEAPEPSKEPGRNGAPGDGALGDGALGDGALDDGALDDDGVLDDGALPDGGLDRAG
jgi:RNA polymerase sigma-70 factor (ECF subfamily)